jgi:hypothetical protein
MFLSNFLKMYNSFEELKKFTVFSWFCVFYAVFRPFVVNIEVKTLNFVTWNYSFSNNLAL